MQKHYNSTKAVKALTIGMGILLFTYILLLFFSEKLKTHKTKCVSRVQFKV